MYHKFVSFASCQTCLEEQLVHTSWASLAYAHIEHAASATTYNTNLHRANERLPASTLYSKRRHTLHGSRYHLASRQYFAWIEAICKNSSYEHVNNIFCLKLRFCAARDLNKSHSIKVHLACHQNCTDCCTAGYTQNAATHCTTQLPHGEASPRRSTTIQWNALNGILLSGIVSK